MSKLFTAADNKVRCYWCQDTQQYMDYHDYEWGLPTHDNNTLFEKLTLESFQSGLSWRTILQKRQGFREVFCDFDIFQVAKFGQKDVESLLQNSAIVRHRGKIEAAINNAQRAVEMIEKEGSLAAFFWRFEPENSQATKPLVSQTEESKAFAKALKKLGWKFIGPTTAYAFMQAAGIVNDHFEGCYSRELIQTARKEFTPPCS